MDWGNVREAGLETEVSIAAVQMDVQLGKVNENLESTIKLVKEAALRGGEIIVLPELCNTGYVFNNYREVQLVAETVPGGKSVSLWSELARQLGVYIVAGIMEKCGNNFYNSSVLIGPEGLMGLYRKIHLFAEEKLFFTPGDLGLPVFKLPFGNVAMLICYDLRFFEAIRILMLKGADLICVPTNWIVLFDKKGIDERGYSMQNYIVMTLANTNQIFMCCANRIGMERGVEFFGRSMIVGTSGWPIAGPASGQNEEILLAKVNLGESKINKTRSMLNDIIKDRRTDIYDEMLGSREIKSPF